MGEWGGGNAGTVNRLRVLAMHEVVEGAWTPRPVASTRPWMPPACGGFPVTQALALMSVVFIRAYWSAIQAISRSPVPMSGAGTFCAGWIRSRLISS